MGDAARLRQIAFRLLLLSETVLLDLVVDETQARNIPGDSPTVSNNPPPSPTVFRGSVRRQRGETDAALAAQRYAVHGYYNLTGSYTVLSVHRWWIGAFLSAWWRMGAPGWVAVTIERLR